MGKTCPFCGKEVGAEDSYCPYCDADLEEVASGEESLTYAGGADPDDFSELDYRPPKKKGFVGPLAVILVIVFIFGGLFIILRDDEESTAQDEDEIAVPDFGLREDEEEEADPEPEEETEEEVEEEETEELVGPPDYDLLEEELQSWLEERVGDPDVIMLHADELEDVDAFFRRYDLEEDNIIIYQIESTDDDFATALFGEPYSEWSLRAVFMWDGLRWEFLRDSAF